MNKLQLRFFGAFRKYFELEELHLNGEIKVAELRKLVAEHLKSKNGGFDALLLDDSVFATDAVVLKETDFVRAGQQIAVLPPVCGG